MKNFFPKITRKEPVPQETSPETSCLDCETPHAIEPSEPDSPVGSGSLEALGKALEAGIVSSELYNKGAFLNDAINAVYTTDSTISIANPNIGGGYGPPSGGGAGGSGGYSPPLTQGGAYPNWTATSYPMPVMSEMKLNRRTLTPEEIQKVLEACTTIVKPGEKVIFVADAGTTQKKVNELSTAMAGLGIDGIALAAVTVEPYENQPVTNEFDRMDMLARLAVVWQENPNLRFGQLVCLALGMGELSPMWNVSDEDLGGVVEKAYRPAGKRMAKKAKP